MPNGEHKNWYRLLMTIDGFRSRYSRWPTGARMSRNLLETLKEDFRSSTLNDLVAQLPIVAVGVDAHLEVIDSEGRTFKYGEERNQEPDIDARSWLGIAPDAQDGESVEPLDISIRVGQFRERGGEGATELKAIVSPTGIYLVLQGGPLMATSEIVSWRTLARDAIRKNPHLFGDLDGPSHQGLRRALENLGFRTSS